MYKNQIANISRKDNPVVQILSTIRTKKTMKNRMRKRDGKKFITFKTFFFWNIGNETSTVWVNP